MSKKTANKTGASGTFALNKEEPIHRWYSYLEGYSSCLIVDLLDELKDENIRTIYDPFGGTGTTMLVASQRGIRSYFSEINPFMCDVVNTKINTVKQIVSSSKKTKKLKDFLNRLPQASGFLDFGQQEWDGFEKFYSDQCLLQVLAIKDMIKQEKDEDTQSILNLALASVLVRSSQMIRRGDLRCARPGEKKPEDLQVYDNFAKKLTDIITDIEQAGDSLIESTEQLSFDSRDITAENLFDCVITSPPYLNGTNYIRNTKLELKLFSYVETEKDLPQYHSRGIIAGINNISKRNENTEILPCVKPYIEQLEPVAYDRRIPQMVSGYFSDMRKVIERLAHGLKNNGVFIMDIGDSQFCGVHIPTHDVLSEICSEFGFVKYEEKILRVRHSNNGMALSQRLLKFRLKKEPMDDTTFEKKAKEFMSELPYKKEPYSGRNWGHAWHSLCSYHGKLKPAIAHLLISNFTQPGDIILDPLGGVGTIPFEACLQGRIGIGNDLSEMAYIVSKAKLERPDITEVFEALEVLQSYLDQNKNSKSIDEDLEKYVSFGFNKTLPEYFHPDTFREILAARRYFYKRYAFLTAAEALVLSALLHVLHGNRPYALSRTSHPLTPYAPKGDFIYKNVVQHVREKIEASYQKIDFFSYTPGRSIYGDFSKISEKQVYADFVICSPPFADSIRFYMQNWMRLWLCGWEVEDFKSADERFLDIKQRKNFELYSAFFEMCSNVLKPKGKVILHLGKTEKVDMAEELSIQAQPYFDEVFRAAENVSEIEKHGIKDKGATVAHQFLFLQKK